MTGFESIKRNFGFGCMRLPMKGAEAYYDEFTRMVDMYMNAGFNYFDTARVCLEGQSETAIRDCIKCGRCERSCPQHLHIRELLQKVAAEFEKQQ